MCRALSGCRGLPWCVWPHWKAPQGRRLARHPQFRTAVAISAPLPAPLAYEDCSAGIFRCEGSPRGQDPPAPPLPPTSSACAGEPA